MNVPLAVQPVVEKLGCGRVQGRAENDPHSQGATIACLSSKVDEVKFYKRFFTIINQSLLSEIVFVPVRVRINMAAAFV